MTKVKGKKLNIAMNSNPHPQSLSQREKEVPVINSKNSNPHPNPLPEGEGVLPDGWVETTLDEVTTIKGGKRLPKGEKLVSQKTDHFYIRITDLENNLIKKDQLQFISDETFLKISRYIVNSGDIIISIVGTIGLVAKIDKELNGANLTENCVKLIDLKELYNKFLYYFLISRLGQGEIRKNTVGAVQKKLPIYGVQNIKINLPPLPQQKAIAGVLSAFDDKIELLREQNETLEKIGQEIFKEWLLPSRQAGGKYSIDDELPDDWRVGKLGEEIEAFLGGTPSKAKKEYWENGNIPWVNSGKVNDFRIIDESEMITEDAVKNSATKILPKGTVVLAITGATLGQYSRLEIDACFNQSVVGLKENEKFHSSYIYFWLAENIQEIIRHASGGAHQHINKENINQTDFLIPSQEVLNDFYEKIDPIMEKISENMFQIQTLSKTRDTLLPKLMKGGIILNDNK